MEGIEGRTEIPRLRGGTGECLEGLREEGENRSGRHGRLRPEDLGTILLLVIFILIALKPDFAH